MEYMVASIFYTEPAHFIKPTLDNHIYHTRTRAPDVVTQGATLSLPTLSALVLHRLTYMGSRLGSSRC